jgi:hypothetical protein
MPNRFVRYADAHLGMVIWGPVVFVLVVMAGSFTIFIRHESNQAERDRVERSRQSIEICKVAVTNGRDTNLEIVGLLREAYHDRPQALAAVTKLENIILRKQNPDTTCVPATKENP